MIALGRLKGHEVIGLVRRDADAAGLAEQFAKVPVIGIDRANWPDAVKAAAGQPPVVAHGNDDALIDSLAVDGIAYVPFFPLGGSARFSHRA